MEIHSENKNGDSSLNGVEEMIKDAFTFLATATVGLLETLRTEFKPIADSFISNVRGNTDNGGCKVTSFGKEVETLDMNTLIGFGKQHIVVGSNEIVAMKVAQPLGYYVYLAYSKDKELLPVQNNVYLIIKTKSLASDVENLFAESEVVILK